MKKNKQDLKKRALRRIILGICQFLPGLIFTVLSYNVAPPGGYYYIFFGLLAFGIWNIVSGVYSFFRPGKELDDISTSRIAARFVRFVVILFAVIMVLMLILMIFGVDLR